MSADDPSPHQPTPRRGVAAIVVGVTLAALAVGALAVGLVLHGFTDAGDVVSGGGGEVPTATDAVARVGSSTDGYAVWDRNADGSPVRWDPCSPIPIVVSHEGAPVDRDAFERDVEHAVADLRQATGLDLRLAGPTDERPAADRPAYVEDDGRGSWAPILVAWAAPGEQDLPLRSFDRGIGAPVAVGQPGARVYVTGQVVLNRERLELVPGRADRSVSWGATVLHELAHVLGLDHVDDRDQLLSVHPGQGPVEFGDGDRAGLAAVGADHGCVEVPEPRPIDVLTTLP